MMVVCAAEIEFLISSTRSLEVLVIYLVNDRTASHKD